MILVAPSQNEWSNTTNSYLDINPFSFLLRFPNSSLSSVYQLTQSTSGTGLSISVMNFTLVSSNIQKNLHICYIANFLYFLCRLSGKYFQRNLKILRFIELINILVLLQGSGRCRLIRQQSLLSSSSGCDIVVPVNTTMLNGSDDGIRLDHHSLYKRVNTPWSVSLLV